MTIELDDHYSRMITYDEETDRWYCDVPEREDYCAEGDTMEEALKASIAAFMKNPDLIETD